MVALYITLAVMGAIVIAFVVAKISHDKKESIPQWYTQEEYLDDVEHSIYLDFLDFRKKYNLKVSNISIDASLTYLAEQRADFYRSEGKDMPYHKDYGRHKRTFREKGLEIEENLFWGTSPNKVIEAFENSIKHKRNMMRDVDLFGVGISLDVETDKLFIAVEFGMYKY